MRINFGLIILAIIVSLALWVLVVSDQNPDRTDTPDLLIPVEISNVPPGLAVMSTLDPVRFRIRAPRDRWDGLQVTSFRASVDLSQARAGIQQIPIRAEASDPQVRVLEVVPQTATIRIDEIQDRTVPVRVNLIGNVPFGYVYGTPRVEPEVVTVTGPASIVQTVEMASVDVRVDGITVAIDSSFHLLPLDPTLAPVRSVRLSPQTAHVRLPVDQQVSYKQVGVRASVSGEVAPGYWIESVSVDPSSITVVGDPNVLGRINYLDTATLDVSGASSTITRDIRIELPDGASALQQQTTRMRVAISSLESSQSVRVAPVVVGMAPELQVLSSPSFVDVTLRGPATAMRSVNLDQVRATFDVGGLGEGTHTVRPSVTAPQGVSVASVSPETFNLTLAPIQTPTPTATPTPSGTPEPARNGDATSTPATPVAGGDQE
jgi:YbbR domain-containing protein